MYTRKRLFRRKRESSIRWKIFGYLRLATIAPESCFTFKRVELFHNERGEAPVRVRLASEN